MDVKTARRSGLKKVGEVADIFGTTPRTLLYYEEQGILSPMKTARGTRMYSDADIKRFEVAYKLSCLGVPLKTIRDLATTRPNAQTGDESGRKLCGILDGLVEDISRQIRHLEFMKQDLERGRLMIRMCWDCPNRPTRRTCPKCPCEVQMDQSQLMWLTWDPDRPNLPPSNPGEPPTKCMEASFPDVADAEPGLTEPVSVQPVPAEPEGPQPKRRPGRRNLGERQRKTTAAAD
ncbi:MerR family transcriptional regulator [Ancylobacter sp. MQZ15Z-1]|uniref:MerR family transcriptional regulator n=1 Tax=Ancylobacter mangrovi TaxID=2972472 RepID=A0A9X2PBM2_9HYPH|nr:MerR family transcriptional regulator [Ancylobacter mangrovi]MCS0495656.1 MerR family transcriptional regulator [Ancylobacter mangrovi]